MFVLLCHWIEGKIEIIFFGWKWNVSKCRHHIRTNFLDILDKFIVQMLTWSTVSPVVCNFWRFPLDRIENNTISPLFNRNELGISRKIFQTKLKHFIKYFIFSTNYLTTVARHVTGIFPLITCLKWNIYTCSAPFGGW